MVNKSRSKGRLIAIGGNEDRLGDLLVLKRVVKEVRKKNFNVAILTTASEEPKKRGRDYTKVFQSLGAGIVNTLNVTTHQQANDDLVIKSLKGIDLIFITGGDQSRLTSIIGESKFLIVLNEMLKTGCTIVGTSAGAAVFSDMMIYEGKSEEGLLKGKVLTASGFGFVKRIVFDTHFMARGRIGRLIQVVAGNQNYLGIGLGEDSAVIFVDDETIEIVGSGQVTMVDGSQIVYSNIKEIPPGEVIAVENIRIHSLVHGDRYNLKQRKFLKPKNKG